MEWIVGPLLVTVAAAVLSRFYDLRRVDDPFVYAFAFVSVFWVLGMGFGSLFPTAPQVQTPTMLFLAAGYMSFVLGGIASTRIPRSSDWLRRYRRLGPNRRLSPKELRLTAGVLIVGLAFVGAFVVIVGGIPLLMPNAEQARVEQRAGLGYLVIAAIWLISLPAVALVSDARFRGWRWLLAVLLVAMAAAVVMAVLGNRAPPVRMLIGVAWVALVAGGMLPRWRTLLTMGAGVLAVLAVTIVLRTGTALTTTAVWNRMEWQMYVNPSNLQRVVDFIPSQIDYLLGSSYMIDIAVLAPGPQPNFSTWLKEEMGLNFPGGGLTISLFGELYANWGPVVGVVVPAFVAIFLSTLRGYVSIRTPLDAAYVILLSLSLGGFMQTGVMTPLLYNVMPLTALYLIVRVTAGNIKRPGFLLGPSNEIKALN